MKAAGGRLYLWVLAGVLAGGLLGWLDPALGVQMKPLGDGFIALIKMLIAPIVFLTVVLGIAGVESVKHVGRIGLKAVVYFEVVSTIALALGLVIVNLLQPGAGFNADPATLDASLVARYSKQAEEQSITDFVLHIIPKSFADPFTGSGDLLQVLLIAILFAFAMSAIGEKARPVRNLLESMAQVFFGIVHLVMKLAPVGAFGAMAFTIGKYGVGSLAPLAKLMGVFYLTCIVFVVLVLGAIARICGFSILRFIAYIRTELLLVLGTSSSESALAPLMEKLEKLGSPKPVVGLVVPAGYSLNLDGTNIYLTMAAVFVAQALGIDLTLGQQLQILLVAMLTSKGAAGVTGSGFITLAATLAVVPSVPVAGLALILGIDRFMSEARALTNIIGNGVAALAVARWDGSLDRAAMEAELGAPRAPDAEPA